jgi:hypothetical protein
VGGYGTDEFQSAGAGPSACNLVGWSKMGCGTGCVEPGRLVQDWVPLGVLIRHCAATVECEPRLNINIYYI